MVIKQAYATKNECYLSNGYLKPVMLMVHSTATPGVGAQRYASAFNQYRPNGRSVCVHGFIDWTSTMYQTLPWNVQAWHCGGSGNQKAIGIELCEPSNYSDKTTGMAVINNAIEIYAQLCKQFNIPVSNIVSHKEGHSMGIASNHGDPDHWWRYIGYTMDMFRAAVQTKLTANETPVDGYVKDDVGVSQESKDYKGIISYQTHVRGIGWLSWKCDGMMAGTTGQNRRIEALRIDAPGIKEVDVHIKSYGDRTYKNPTFSTTLGTTGEQKRIESILIKSDEPYVYRVHQKSYGWSDWKFCGHWAGVKGEAKQLEAIEIRKAKVYVQAHVQSKGWLDMVPDGVICGSIGGSKRLEAFKIDPLGKEVAAKVHIQSYGWKDYGVITKDTVIGTVGEGKRLECICLKGDFEYRVHIQGSGWTDWTKADGIATLGTVGEELRIEAFEIR